MSLGVMQILLLAAFFLLPASAIYSENSDKKVERRKYILAVLGTILAVYILPQLHAFALLGLIPLHIWIVPRLTVQRARDCGINKGAVYLYLIPGVNIILCLVLCVYPGRATDGK